MFSNDLESVAPITDSTAMARLVEQVDTLLSSAIRWIASANNGAMGQAADFAVGIVSSPG